MCGIAGCVSIKHDISSESYILDAMLKMLESRGPDQKGKYISKHALLAHRRLSIIDPTRGLQPMKIQKGDTLYIIVYNGELYNTNELRLELLSCGHSFKTTSDTEVLLTSYIEWKEKCVNKLNGIFAFGVWDDKEKSLFLARDHFGVKPLFYSIKNDLIIFASDLKTLLLHPDVFPDVSVEGLCEIFCLGPSRTPGHGIYKNVYEIKPAHYLKYTGNSTIIKRYWQLESHPHEDDFRTTVEKVKFLVSDAIKRQLVSDVPLCTFLSGGLDSSIITAISAQHFKENLNQNLHTFSIDYEGNEKYFKKSSFQPDADAPWVKRMSEAFNTQHHYIRFSSRQVADNLLDAVEAKGLPGMADIDSSLLLFCREIKKEFKVALSGECADEVFGGYPWYHKPDLLWAGTFPWIRTPEEKYSILNPELVNIMQPKRYIKIRYMETVSQTPILPGESEQNKKRREMFYLNFHWFMATLLERKDRMSMGTGLEIRVPYCDYRLVQYVWNIPWDMKMYKNREKGLLREAAKIILPKDVLYRKKSPYPKTHNPEYEKIVKRYLDEIINNPTSPILPLLNTPLLKKLMDSSSDYGKPWFGQLMARPQLYAFLIQTNHWLKTYNVNIA